MAEEKFGKERAEQLRAEIEALAADIEQIRAFEVEIDDEP